jgi:hypothetical protein
MLENVSTFELMEEDISILLGQLGPQKFGKYP